VVDWRDRKPNFNIGDLVEHSSLRHGRSLGVIKRMGWDDEDGEGRLTDFASGGDNWWNDEPTKWFYVHWVKQPSNTDTDHVRLGTKCHPSALEKLKNGN